MKIRWMVCVQLGIGIAFLLWPRPLPPAESMGLLGGSGGEINLKDFNYRITGEKGNNPTAVLKTSDFSLEYSVFEFDPDTKTLVATGSKGSPLVIEMRGQGFKAFCDKLIYEAASSHYVLTGGARIAQSDEKGSVTMAGDMITLAQEAEGEVRVEIRKSGSGGQRAMLSTRPAGKSGASKGQKESGAVSKPPSMESNPAPAVPEQPAQAKS